MSRILINLSISLIILLVSLATVSLADTCTVCKYDGTAYHTNSVSEYASDLCLVVKNDMGADCVNKAWYTHFKDTKYNGQKTYCRIKCKDQKTLCASHWTDQPNVGPKNGPHDSLIGGVHMPCDQWPTS
ncbi:uncharacterized protein MELLADRAFT_109354 [Melampsora larici-populina 98AG31]|uniref:Secreted protein n=1 Tax=Melampsora larici-populina (strain 98AG31 / pathotype 3-4-7) TaxID=747676 RepID=F4RW69_MELLP|nr:uncharacterized protein MELLADRAFT_109354 [Melampsora larici-populina 98AG31]EGG03230.1 secreted protein [Melampsora larici-populina 98AG31]